MTPRSSRGSEVRRFSTVKSLRFSAVALFTLILLVGACGGEATAAGAPFPTVTLRLAYTVPLGSRVDKVAHKFKELAESRSQGRLILALHPAGQMANDRDVIDLLQAGSVDMNIQGAVMFNAVTPEFGVISLPFVFRDQAHFRKFLASDLGKQMESRLLKRKGIRVLGVLNEGAVHITSKTKPILRPEDAKGFKVRVPEIPVDLATWTALGAIPTVLPFDQLFTALQQGMVDGQYNPLDTTFNASLQEVQKQLSLIGMKRLAKWIFFSEVTYQKLDSTLQKVVGNAALEAAAYGDGLQTEEENEYLNRLKAARVNVHQISPAPFAEIVMKSVLPKFIDKWEPGVVGYINGL